MKILNQGRVQQLLKISGMLLVMVSWLCMVIAIGNRRVLLSLLGFRRPPGSQSRLCANFKGRLGNHLFLFASMIGIARSKGMVPVLPRDSILVQVFELDGVTKTNNSLCDFFPKHFNVRDAGYDRGSVDFTNATGITLSGYYQSFKFFENSEDEVRHKFRIKSDFMANASKKLEASVNDQLGKVSLSDKTFVGIHVRRGDYLNNTEFGTVVASREYLQRATDFFRSRYKRVIFVVCSDDLDWCKENIIGGDVVFIEGQSAELDFVTLTLCNHTIMTVGTFGWWAAWLTNGVTLYYKHQYLPGSPMSEQYNLSDFFPAEWIEME